MRIGDIIFAVVVNIPVMVVMAIFLMSDTFTLPPLPLQSPKAIFNVLWTILLLVTLATTAMLFFVKRNNELTVRFGLMGSVVLFLLATNIELLPE